MQVKKQQLELYMEQWTGSKLGKELKAALSPRLFNLYAEYTIQNARLDEAQTESRLPRGRSTTSEMHMITTCCRK